MKTILFFLFISIPYIVLSNSFGTINEVANENGTLLLTAPKGTVIDGIFFASYGSPNGTASYYTIGACHAANSIAAVSAIAIGQNSVSIIVTNNLFGDPCPGVVKRLYVTATYSSSSLNLKEDKKEGFWTFFSDGLLKEEGNFKEGKKEGVWKYYNEGGKIIEEVTYKKGEQNGLLTTYGKNGQLREEETYKQGKREGLWKAYYCNGQLIEEGNYSENAKNGRWTFYTKRGDLSYKGAYKNNDKVGDWFLYDINKKVVSMQNQHKFLNGRNKYPYTDSTYTIDRSRIYFANNEANLVAYSDRENGKSYRIIDFQENEPIYGKGLRRKNKDLSVVDEGWGYVTLKFHKKVKLIMVDFYDDGCGQPFTKVLLKNRFKQKVESYKSISDQTPQNLVFNDPKTLSKMTFFEITHCEGSTNRITIIYE
jgi:antitoxin component YwqK of YwqJK toxin-antitoxin module